MESILNQIFQVNTDSIPAIFLAVFLICFFGAFIGGMTGLGGAMLIKPMLGSILGMAATTIGLYVSKFISTTVVLGTSATSVQFYRKRGFHFSTKLFIYMSIGVAIGIILVGQFWSGLEPAVELIAQGILYILVFTSVLFRNHYPKLKFDNNIPIILIIGIIIGIICAFFGIGGGAVKIPFFIIFFSMTMKQAAVYSFLIALVTEPLKLVQYGKHIFETPDIGPEALILALVLGLIAIPAAIIGGLLGVKIQAKSSDNFVANAFNAVVIYFAITSLASGLLMYFGYLDSPWSIINLLN